MKYILGVDAGSTKTDAAIADETGKIIGRGNSGPANIHQPDSKKNLKKAIDNALADAGIKAGKFASACFGVAGTDTPKSLKKAKDLVSKIISAENLQVYNDTMLVRPACSDKKYGISVVAGTGSNFYGIDSKGREERVGGLDYLLADEGSAYRIGQQGMNAAVKSYDTRGEKTMIENLLLEKFKVKSIRELANVVYDKNFGKYEIASIAQVVDYAYSQGDAVAKSILSEAAYEIALAINTLITKLELEKEDPSKWDIVATGGEFMSPYPFEEKVREKILANKNNFMVCKTEPVDGAIKLALEGIK